MKTLLIVCGVGFLVGVGVTALKYENNIAEYKLDAEKAKSELIMKQVEADKAKREAVYQIESEYLKQLNDKDAHYEKVIADMRNEFNPSGVFDCSRNGECMPRKDGSTSEFVCYRTSELRSKITRTLAIGKEADELALKYNALLGLK